VKSKFHPAKIRVDKPERMEMTLAIDEIRKRKVHGFDRSDGCDNTKQLRRLPIVPKSRIRIEKYRLNCTEILFNNMIRFPSVDEYIITLYFFRILLLMT